MRFNANTPRLQIMRDGVQVDTGRPLHQMVTAILLHAAAHLGYCGKKLPAAGLPPMDIQGVKVWVDSLPEVETRTNKWGDTYLYRPFKLRVQSECPQCGWQGAFGRFHQHTCK